MSHFSFCLRFCNMRLFWEVFKHCELMFLFGISYLLLPKSLHLLASISSFKSIASTLSNPITTMKPICGSGIGKGKIFKVKADLTTVEADHEQSNVKEWNWMRVETLCWWLSSRRGYSRLKRREKKTVGNRSVTLLAADTPSSQLFLLTILF